MDCKNLINLVDKFNEHNIIAALTLKPENSIFIYENYEEQIKEFEEVKSYLEDKLPSGVIAGVLVDRVSGRRIHEIINKYSSKDTIVNISGGSKIMSLMAYQAAESSNMRVIFIDVDNKKILKINANEVEELSGDLKNLEVEDFITSTGGEIIHDSTSLVNNEPIQEYVKYIIENLDVWDELKRVLKDSTIITHDKTVLDTVEVNLEGIEEYHKKRFQGFFTKLRELNLINVTNTSESKFIVRFTNLDAKTILFKTGTWLEVLVYELIKEIKEVSDVKGGVVFLWDGNVRYVKNEIDVIAAANSQLIYVSCKDTEKYDENTLNELQVYAGQLGGEEVKKILVATKESEKRSLKLRAEKMGIHLVIFNGNIEELKEKLSKVIKEAGSK